MLPIDYGCWDSKVVILNRYLDGNLIGVRNRNTLLDSRFYTVDFDDRTLRHYVDNIISRNMYDQVYDEVIEHFLKINII